MLSHSALASGPHVKTPVHHHDHVQCWFQVDGRVDVLQLLRNDFELVEFRLGSLLHANAPHPRVVLELFQELSQIGEVVAGYPARVYQDRLWCPPRVRQET